MNIFNIILPDVVRSVLGILFIISISFSVVEILLIATSKLKNTISEFIKEKKIQKTVLGYVKELSEKEKEYLYLFIRENSITIDMPVNDGIVSSLHIKGIIYRASFLGKPGFSFKFAYNIQPFIFEYLKDHLNYFDGVKKV